MTAHANQLMTEHYGQITAAERRRVVWCAAGRGDIFDVLRTKTGSSTGSAAISAKNQR